jgi:hypothetical protein
VAATANATAPRTNRLPVVRRRVREGDMTVLHLYDVQNLYVVQMLYGAQ